MKYRTVQQQDRLAFAAPEDQAQNGGFRASCLSTLGEVAAVLGVWADRFSEDILTGYVESMPVGCAYTEPLTPPAVWFAGVRVSCGNLYRS